MGESMLERYFQDPSKVVDYSRSRTENTPAMEFHMHDRFEIYYFISGDVHYFIEKNIYRLQYGDLLIMNSSEIHKPQFLSGAPYERIAIHFDPEIARQLSSPSFDLLKCFTDRPKGEQNKISLNQKQLADVEGLLQKYGRASQNRSEGSEILKLTYFIELLVYINRIFTRHSPSEDEPQLPRKLASLLEYIDRNLEGDLSLEALSRMLYLDKSYLSRLFKSHTGMGIQQYILYKRVSAAKALLAQGTSVTEACGRSGFNDYSNFIRTFRKIAGVAPGQYRRERARL